ncbi:hypothetical protein VP01_355g1 [Puccinia sorghi]|uniref:Uncharacterized protein n=1 Tax=Puccinia sorghi TaxID=27349 RepID=A0A0L6UXA1_9BASI|nr:hypothetical protein VP01_355g1 [Puccinia sorghi]
MYTPPCQDPGPQVGWSGMTNLKWSLTCGFPYTPGCQHQTNYQLCLIKAEFTPLYLINLLVIQVKKTERSWQALELIGYLSEVVTEVPVVKRLVMGRWKTLLSGVSLRPTYLVLEDFSSFLWPPTELYLSLLKVKLIAIHRYPSYPSTHIQIQHQKSGCLEPTPETIPQSTIHQLQLHQIQPVPAYHPHLLLALFLRPLLQHLLKDNPIGLRDKYATVLLVRCSTSHDNSDTINDDNVDPDEDIKVPPPLHPSRTSNTGGCFNNQFAQHVTQDVQSSTSNTCHHASCTTTTNGQPANHTANIALEASDAHHPPMGNEMMFFLLFNNIFLSYLTPSSKHDNNPLIPIISHYLQSYPWIFEWITPYSLAYLKAQPLLLLPSLILLCFDLHFLSLSLSSNLYSFSI